MHIRSIIVDDEKHGRENLAGLLKQFCPYVEVIAEADSVECAITQIETFQPDLLFLDIEMPEANGFDLLEHFSEFNFEVIFVTAFDHYAIKAIRFSASDYILKPINYKDLVVAVEKVSERILDKKENLRIKELFNNIHKPSNPKIGLPTADRVEFVDINKIVRCKGEGNYTMIYLDTDKHILVAKTLVEFEELLQEYNFVRVHKTHLVNINHVNAYLKQDGGMLQLIDGTLVPISRRRKELVKSKLEVKIV